MVEFDINAARGCVSVRFAGLLTATQASDYVDQVGSAFVKAIGRRRFVMLIDATEAKLQTQEVMGIFERQIAHFPHAERMALVVGTSPARMQLRRLLTRDYARFFDTRAEAEAWLLDGWRPDRGVAGSVSASPA